MACTCNSPGKDKGTAGAHQPHNQTQHPGRGQARDDEGPEAFRMLVCREVQRNLLAKTRAPPDPCTPAAATRHLIMPSTVAVEYLTQCQAFLRRSRACDWQYHDPAVRWPGVRRGPARGRQHPVPIPKICRTAGLGRIQGAWCTRHQCVQKRVHATV